MNTDYQITVPVLFNPLKHHLRFQRDFINKKADEPHTDIKNLIKELKHLGASVMDVYSGSVTVRNICLEVLEFLRHKDILEKESFFIWTGTDAGNFRIITLSDGSQWTLKYYDSDQRFVHIFPARNSPQTFRVKANTLKPAILYNIVSGKDYITADDLNRVRVMLSLSPVKDNIDTEAVTEMIEILRVSD